VNVAPLIRWQWEGYQRYHKSRANLLLHIVLVPLFLAANFALIVALLQGVWWLALVALGVMVLSIALQGRAHRLEAVPPEPFTSALNAMLRIFLEQWVTFPRFVFSGGWSRAIKAAR
jgi:uncharacterized membrane protein YGL010W